MKHTAQVLGRMFDAIEFRGSKHQDVLDLERYSGVPVWNGLSDECHPTQILADFMTIQEKFGKLKGIKLIFIGDGRNNVANSLMVGCAKAGIDMVNLAPKELWPKEELITYCKEQAEMSDGSIFVTEDTDAVEGADVIYTDVWCSMGEEHKAEERVRLLRPYQVNKELMDKTGKKETIFMHCLPAVLENEVTEEVFESEASVVFDEAENRLHTIKAVMVATLGNDE